MTTPREGTLATKARFGGLALLLAVGILATACGQEDPRQAATDGGGAPASECPDAEGDVIVSGSSTVEPISARVGELVEECDILANVDGPGTGDGFQLFCAGETDISDASRPIKAEEAAQCEKAGIDFIELKVGIDGIAVLTNPDNDVECLSFADLYALIGPESEGVGDWADGQDLATELGSNTTFPDAPLDITGPGEESGTYDSFTEIVFGDISEARAEEGAITDEQVETTRKDYSSQSDDNAIIAGVEGSPSSLGWVGFAFAEEAGDGVKAVPISEEPGGECVEPTPDTIADTSYPISRDLYIYVNAGTADENPAVAAYVDHYLSDEGIEAVEEVGYVALTEEDLEATRAVWESRETGSRDGDG
jgi:phosphate transport system substrate-binding protein